jgi:hypothetical protein
VHALRLLKAVGNANLSTLWSTKPISQRCHLL